MIFKQVDEILSGRKTETRRVCKPDENGDFGGVVYQRINKDNELMRPILRVKWEVGRTYAVQPGRGKPTVWWAVVDGIPIWNHPVRYEPFYQPGEPTDWEKLTCIPARTMKGRKRHETEKGRLQNLRQAALVESEDGHVFGTLDRISP